MALDLASSLSRKLAYVPGPTFGFVKLLASSGSHCTKWADEQHRQAGFESRLVPDLPSPYLHFNRPSGFWPCVKSCVVGGSDKYHPYTAVVIIIAQDGCVRDHLNWAKRIDYRCKMAYAFFSHKMYATQLFPISSKRKLRKNILYSVT